MSEERRLQDFMMTALWRHGRQLPADKFDAIIFVKNASFNHRLDIRNGKTMTRQTVRGLRGLWRLRRGGSYERRVHHALQDIARSIQPQMRNRTCWLKTCSTIWKEATLLTNFWRVFQMFGANTPSPF